MKSFNLDLIAKIRYYEQCIYIVEFSTFLSNVGAKGKKNELF